MNKIYTMAFLLSFWLVLPIVFKFMGLGNYDVINLTDLEKQELPTALNILVGFLNFFVVYFKMMFLWVDGLGGIYNAFLWLLRAITGFVIIIMLRGN